MPNRTDPRYRLVVHTPAGRAVFRDETYDSYDAAQTHVAQVVREFSATPLIAIELQRGQATDVCVFDPDRVIPGVRGGWSDTRWVRLRRWDEAVIERICRQVEERRANSGPASLRVFTLGVAVALLAAFSVLLVQTGGSPASVLTSAESDFSALESLPLSAIPTHSSGEPLNDPTDWRVDAPSRTASPPSALDESPPAAWLPERFPRIGRVSGS